MSAQTALQEAVIVDDFKAKIDRFGELQGWLSSFSREYEALKKELAAEANFMPSDTLLTLQGNYYKLEFSASAIGHELAEDVSVEGLLALYGAMVVKPDITAIRKYESLHQVHESVLAVKIGSRKLIKTLHRFG